MNCPVCNRPTRRLVYDKRGKRCRDCNDPNFIRMPDLPGPSPEISRLCEMLNAVYARTGEQVYRCVITPNSKVPP